MRASPWIVPLARQFAEEALTRERVRLRLQKRKGGPRYLQVRHRRFRQVVAYVHLRPGERRIEYPLPPTNDTYGVATSRDHFYGIEPKVHSRATWPSRSSCCPTPSPASIDPEDGRMRRFVNDDAGYGAWLAAHPRGYVLNTFPHVTSTYLVLHRAACRTINRPLAAGRSWTIQYGKTCADDRPEIEAWSLRETGMSVKPCGICLKGERAYLSATTPGARVSGGGRAPRPAHVDVAFDGEPIRIVVPRSGVEAAPRLVIDGAQWLAETFFRRDPSAAEDGSYDAWIRETQLDPARRDRLIDGDITAVNKTMAARTSHAAWAPVIGPAAPAWLAGLDPGWDLFETDEGDVGWATIAAGLGAAFAATHRPGLGLAVVTKVLHIKRPRLIPVMDSVVLQQIGARVSGDVTTWVEAIEQVRAVGRQNIAELRAIRAHLQARAIADRTLVRILDALLWVSSPGAGLFDSLDGWERVFRPKAD
jgi:hypothetical protein